MPRFACCCLLLLAVLGSQALADPPTVLYRLGGESAFLEGCIEGLCLCPVKVTYIAGTFGVTPAPDGAAGVQTFAISDIDWFTHVHGEAWSTIRGSGTYTLGDETHRLVLDLEIDGDPPIRVDSGEVPAGGSFPTIDIGGLTATQCYQEGVDIVAGPAASSIEIRLAPTDMLTWTVDPAAAAYDVVAGDLSALRSSGGDFSLATGACVAGGVTVPALAYSAATGPGDAIWFLVRGLPEPGYDSGGAGQAVPRSPAIDASPAACR